MMQERAPSRARKPTARRSAERVAQRERTWARFSSPGLIVTTRKIVAFVSGEETSCETTTAGTASWALIGSDAIGIQPVRARRNSTFEKLSCPQVISGRDSLPKVGE